MLDETEPLKTRTHFEKPTAPPMTQEHKNPRESWPAWMKALPRTSIDPNPDFQLVPRAAIETYQQQLSEPAEREAFMQDIATLDSELLDKFRRRDYLAKKNQNRYRKVQVWFVVLASLATIFGSLQALVAGDLERPALLPIVAFIETVIALVAVFLTNVIGARNPYNEWISNRRVAEGLRREYFRFLMYAPPYDTITDRAERERTLAMRAADINRGKFPDTPTAPTPGEQGG